MNLGDKVKVVVKEIDNLGRVNLSMKALLPKPRVMWSRLRANVVLAAAGRSGGAPHRGFGGGRGGHGGGR